MNVREAVLTVDDTQTSFLEQGPSLIERAARTAAAAAADADGVDRDARFPHKAFDVAREQKLLGVMIPLANMGAVAVLAAHSERGFLSELARHPLVLSSLAGFAWNLSGLPLPGFADQTLALLGQTAYETSLTYNLSVIPLFVLMGYVAGEAGLNQSLYRACNAWLGHRRGGLALATIGACGAFDAICGSSLATAATMAQIALPEMRKYKYDDKLATGSVAAGGTIGILIPPSVVMVIYGLLTETSISALFLAGFIPGILTVLGFMAAISVMTRIDPTLGPPAARTPMPERFRALGSVWGTAALFLVVIGGLYIGWFSPTFMPNQRSSHLTNASIAISTGPKIRTTQSIGRATSSAMRSGALIAAVFGSTSENTTIRNVITTVA